jgi:hypothetical protein
MGYGPLTAYTFWTATIVILVLAMRWKAKHSQAERFDDRLSFERMDRAREWLILKGGELQNGKSKPADQAH